MCILIPCVAITLDCLGIALGRVALDGGGTEGFSDALREARPDRLECDMVNDNRWCWCIKPAPKASMVAHISLQSIAN